jgi:hypothetical protein
MAPKLLVGFLLVSISCISRHCGDSRWGLPELQGLTSDLLAQPRGSSTQCLNRLCAAGGKFYAHKWSSPFTHTRVVPITSY